MTSLHIPNFSGTEFPGSLWRSNKYPGEFCLHSVENGKASHKKTSGKFTTLSKKFINLKGPLISFLGPTGAADLAVLGFFQIEVDWNITNTTHLSTQNMGL